MRNDTQGKPLSLCPAATRFLPRRSGWRRCLRPELDQQHPGPQSFLQNPWGQNGFRVQNFSDFRQIVRRVYMYSVTPSPASIGSVWDDSPAPLQEPCHSRGNSTVTGISNNCKCLHILLALVLLPHKFATNQRKDLVFKKFFFGLGNCGGTVDL